jgi:hypothetical protein
MYAKILVVMFSNKYFSFQTGSLIKEEIIIIKKKRNKYSIFVLAY